jgi:hypothetical protein
MDIHFQEPDMPQGNKSADTAKKQRPAGAIEKVDGQKSVARLGSEARAWPAVNNLNGGGKKIASGRKIPSGPVGGSGRKTNLARSS